MAVTTAYRQPNTVDVALRAYLGKTIIPNGILIKPNMVDPAMRTACTDVERLQGVVDALHDRGARDIFIGDEPAAHVTGNAKDHHHTIGYDLIKRATLVDLRDLPVTEFTAVHYDPLTADPILHTIPVRNTAGLFVVDMTLPKQHGNYNYSGVTKNLMGLVPAEHRIEHFHNGFMDACNQTGKQFNLMKTPFDFVRKYAAMNNLGRQDIHDPVIHAYNAFKEGEIGPLGLLAQLEHTINADALVQLAAHARKQDGLYILDGTYTLDKHEHYGEPRATDFAIIGDDSYPIDMLGLQKLGIKLADVPYLAKMNGTTVEYPEELGPVGTPVEVMDKEQRQNEEGYYYFQVK